MSKTSKATSDHEKQLGQVTDKRYGKDGRRLSAKAIANLTPGAVGNRGGGRRTMETTLRARDFVTGNLDVLEGIALGHEQVRATRRFVDQNTGEEVEREVHREVRTQDQVRAFEVLARLGGIRDGWHPDLQMVKELVGVVEAWAVSEFEASNKALEGLQDRVKRYLVERVKKP